MKATASAPLSLFLLLLLTYPISGHLHANRGSVLISDTSTSSVGATAFVQPKSNSQPSTLPISSANAVENDEGILFRQAAIVGIVTATMGHIYGHILDGTVKGVWSYLPNYLLQRGMLDNDVGHWYIPLTCSIGGLLMGILSIRLNPSFIVTDFVRALSGSDAHTDIFPSKLMPALFNLLLLSLVTSTFGFSVGPEAPMVCAGGLVGKALSDRWNDECNMNTRTGCNRDVIMIYAGAAGALTAFMGIPLAGSIFALELTRASAGMSSVATDALAPAVAASVAALVFIRGIADPKSTVGGHFRYLPCNPSGRVTVLTSLVCGIGGAFVATVFHKSVHFLKDVLWTDLMTDDEIGKDGKTSLFQFDREVLVKTAIGVAVGLLSMKYPSTMFWGEGSLQTAIDAQRTPFTDTKHGLPSFLTAHAIVDPNIPIESSWAAAQVGLAKLVSIALACAGKFPGGIIFPLFFAAAPLANAICLFVSQHLDIQVSSVAIMALMASTQASVTRTPLATVLMLALSASPGTELSKMLPCVILSSYIGVFSSRYISKESYFAYST